MKRILIVLFMLGFAAAGLSQGTALAQDKSELLLTENLAPGTIEEPPPPQRTDDRDFELKVMVVTLFLFLGLIFLFTPLRSRFRVYCLLGAYIGYVIFQCIYLIEFFPFTAFQMYSFEREKMAYYLKLVPVLEDGTIVTQRSHEVMPMLADGRAKRYIRDAINRKLDVMDDFATLYSKAYDKRFRKEGGPGIKEVRFEKWLWDFVNDPHDENRGRMIDQKIGIPRRGES